MEYETVKGMAIGGWLTIMALSSCNGIFDVVKDVIVQEPFVKPSKIEVIVDDLDHNGKNETILKVDNRSYLVRYVDGKPTVSPYTIKTE